jgi:predicted membrane protein
MSFDPILAIISIIFGILVIAIPDILGWIVGIFFILLGIWLLLDYMNKGQKKGTEPSQAPPAQAPMEKK